jgi:hypothetical protein
MVTSLAAKTVNETTMAGSGEVCVCREPGNLPVLETDTICFRIIFANRTESTKFMNFLC